MLVACLYRSQKLNPKDGEDGESSNRYSSTAQVAHLACCFHPDAPLSWAGAQIPAIVRFLQQQDPDAPTGGDPAD